MRILLNVMMQPSSVDESTASNSIAIRLAIGALVIATFAPLVTYEFTNYDDPLVITLNEHIRNGLTWDNFLWAWTTGYFANWMPLTWISHQLDTSLYGNWAGGHHLTSLLLHLVGTLFLFEFLRLATGSPLASATAAMLWGVHPLHVESVAWIADRKGILSECLGMMSLWLYVRHVRKPSHESLGLVLLVYAFSLCAKQTLVTLPFLLLLLDAWPLHRLDRRSWRDALAEKTPFFVLAIIFSVIAFFAQRSGDAVANLTELPIPWRLANACFSAVEYLRRFFLPTDLQVFYPYPFDELTTANIAIRAFLLLTVTHIAWRLRKRCPWLAFGWAWYLIALLPLIGFIPIGRHGMADRYADIPMIGIVVAVVWTSSSLLSHVSCPRWITQWLAFIAVLGVAFLGAIQRSHWKDSRSLFGHALRVNRDNPMAHNQWGLLEWEDGRAAPAFEHFRAAADTDPTLPLAHANLAVILEHWGLMDAAIDRFHQSAEWGKPESWIRSSRALAREGRLDAALIDARRAFDALPRDADAIRNLGHIHLLLDEAVPAERYLSLAARLKPNDAESHRLLGTLYLSVGRLPDATRELTLASTIDPMTLDTMKQQLDATPHNARLRAVYAGSLYNLGQVEQAAKQLEAAESNARKGQDEPLLPLIESWKNRIRQSQPLTGPGI